MTDESPADDDPSRRLRFTRLDRILNKRDFDRVYAAGRRGSAGTVVVRVEANGAGRRRLGLSVSRRVGGAVRRNRIKRRLREVFRLNRSRFPAGVDIVVTGHREMANVSFEDLTEHLVTAVTRAFRARPRPPRERRSSR